jgi:peptidoglycan-associated lipoprotein
MLLSNVISRSLVLLVISFSLGVVSGCAGKKAADTSADAALSVPMIQEENLLGDSDSGKAAGLQTVHFPYDSFILDTAAKKVLAKNSTLLKEKASLKVQVEGHCDQRGGIQYNIALGEKRASSVKKYLEDSGIAGVRISTISYGKERLIDSVSTEAAYAKNRRANFVITSK